MYRFRSIKYLTITGIMTGLLVAVGYSSSLFFGWTIASVFGGNSTLQLFDALLMPFCAIFEGPMMLFSGPIAGAIFDLISGVKIITVPVTIFIRIVMYFTIKMLINKYWWSSFYSFFCAGLILIFSYPIYYILIFNNRAIVINELITDIIQASFAYFAAIPIYYFLKKAQINSNYFLWNDHDFDYLKKTKKLDRFS